MMSFRGTVMKLLRPTILLALALGAVASGLPAHHVNAAASSVGTQSLTQATLYGVGKISPSTLAANKVYRVYPGQEIRNEPQDDRPTGKAAGSAPPIPTPGNNPVYPAGHDAGFSGFNGLSHYDQRLAGLNQYAGTQFSLEPPDQALCAGNGFVVEGVNNAFQIFSSAGVAVSGVTPASQFFRQFPEIQRGPNPLYGQFISDPKCYFDSDSGHWFLTELALDTDPTTGVNIGPSHTLIGVSQSADPTGSWNLYTLDTTNNTGTPDHAGCPCFGDQPLIGADANGFYITTNEFPVNGPGFNGAQVYAMSKSGLASGAVRVPVVQISNIPLAESMAYSIQPATAPGGNYETANGGTEYFLSALDFNATTDNRVAVWALTNSSSLNSATPSVTLSDVVITSESYGQPPNATQKPGPAGSTPLGTSLGAPLEQLNSNDDRMNQVVFANGRLWGAVNTIVASSSGPNRVGIAYFVVKPSDPSGTLSATMDAQGYVAVNLNNVMFPSIGVTPAGKAVMSFTLVGPSYFPSTAYMRIQDTARPVHIAGVGAGPDDGFTAYAAYGGNGVARWGDYSAAVADSDGTIWLAAEYIPGGPRTQLANWGTFISHVTP